MAYTVAMELGGVSLGDNFPIYSKVFQYIRADDQAPAIKKVSVTLTGFLEGDSNYYIMSIFQTLKASVDPSGTTFNYEYLSGAGNFKVHDNQECWIESYNEPADQEFGRTAVGEYSITLYWFEDADEGVPIVTTYVTEDGTYTFPKTPKWGRKITQNRESIRAARYGTSAEITLEGVLKADDHASLKAMVDSITNYFAKDGVLAYGSFSQSVRVIAIEVQPVTMRCYAMYHITLGYDTGTIIKLSRKMSISRIHNFPVITEQPFCDSRLIEFMNLSGQTITYSLSITAVDIPTCRTALATEIAATFIFTTDMIEMPGGGEVWDFDNMKVELNITKFYPTIVVPNLFGTG